MNNIYLHGPKFYTNAQLKYYNDFYYDKEKMPFEENNKKSMFDANNSDEE